YQGLSSPGLTCYLNSVLQVLFMTEEFREAVKRFGTSSLSYILKEAKSKPYSDDNYVFSACLQQEPYDVYKVISKRLMDDKVFEQRDAAEYFEKILCRTNPNASEHLIVLYLKIFKGELNHKTTCLNCKMTNDSTNFFWVLPLSMGDSKSRSYSVLKGWSSFFQAQRVSKDNQMFCSGCNQKHDADIEYEMIHCPDVLTLLLKRFSFDYQQNRYVKLHCRVDVAQTLEVKQYIYTYSVSASLYFNLMYDLYAVVHHFGDLMGGHYTADVKSFETGNWYCFNDNTV
uniref:Ubiquitin carboxyl-terminal hydrolase 47-like n=1 Tax=Poecilia formosa TaxID=48698 RepID=A0A096MGC9_POEFO